MNLINKYEVKCTDNTVATNNNNANTGNNSAKWRHIDFNDKGVLGNAPEGANLIEIDDSIKPVLVHDYVDAIVSIDVANDLPDAAYTFIRGTALSLGFGQGSHITGAEFLGVEKHQAGHSHLNSNSGGFEIVNVEVDDKNRLVIKIRSQDGLDKCKGGKINVRVTYRVPRR